MLELQGRLQSLCFTVEKLDGKVVMHCAPMTKNITKNIVEPSIVDHLSNSVHALEEY